MIASMIARSGSGLTGGEVTEGALFSFSLSLSKTCVASSSSSQSMSSSPFFAFPFAFAAGCGGWEAEELTTPAGPGRVLAGGGIGGGWDCARIVALGLVAFATTCGGWLDGPDAGRFGSEPRAGGGGGLVAGGCEEIGRA